MKRRRAAAGLLLGAGLALAGCDPPPRVDPPPPPPADPLLGRWQQETDRVEFFADGHVLLHRYDRTVLGEYARVEPDRVVMVFRGPLPEADADDFRIRVSGDTARFCQTYRPERCMLLVRAASDWIVGDRWVDTVPVHFARPPDPVGEPSDIRMIRASQILRQLHALQTAFRSEEGRLARDLLELEQRGGWQPTELDGYLTPEMAVAGERLCIVARPRVADLPALYLRSDGRLGYGAACPWSTGTREHDPF